MKIEKLHLENFKYHKNSTIDPKKITILIGPNGVGKSSILQSLLVMKRTLQKRESVFTLQDDTLDLGKYDDIVRFRKLNDPLMVKFSGIKKLSHGLLYSDPTDCKFEYSVTMVNQIIAELHLDVKIGDYTIYYDNNGKTTVAGITSRFKEFHLESRNPMANFFHPQIDLDFNQVSSELKTKIGFYSDWDGFVRRFYNLFGNGSFTMDLLDNYYYVPFLRTVSKYSVQFFSSKEYVFNNPEKTSAALFSRISMNNTLGRLVSDLISNLFGKTMQSRNVPSKNDAEKTEVTIDVMSGEFASALINEGTGLNQVVLLLSSLIEAPTNSVIGIEEPEIHLHPEAQGKLAKIMLAVALNDSKQIILTTHSEHMLYPFLASVASKKDNALTKDDLAIYYVGKDEQKNCSKIEPLEVNEFGQIKGGLKGFWDADLKAFSEFLGDDK